ncbi:MAG TPA: ATP-binding protein [Thermoanaerobaculia bacterium]|nr:ATP-binding protein [Thermoanaerobaculia bacterium]
MAEPGTSRPIERIFPVRALGDVLIVRKRAQELGIQYGLGARRATEMAIAVSELATNIVKYGVHGEVVLVLDDDAGTRGGIRVVARDVGPPIRNLEVALQDGCDDTGPIDPALVLRRGGLGTGLGAVLRFADLFEYQQSESGKAIIVTFYR